MLKKLSIFAAIILPLSSSFGAVNLIRNPGFETDVPPGTNDSQALYWQYGQPDTHGDRFGTAARRTWVPRSGSYHGAIEGSWSKLPGTSGGYWQETNAYQGMTYQASAWFAANTDWSPGYQTLKIEFYNSTTSLLKTVAQTLPSLSTNYAQVTVTGLAPRYTAWVRLVIYVENVSSSGSLWIDDVEMYEIPSRTENFNTWPSLGDGCHEFGGWQVCTGRTTLFGSRTGYAASLPSSNNYVRSPNFENGVGNISFWYRHGSTDTNEESIAAISFEVQKSADGVIWQTIASVSNVNWVSYQPFTKALNESDAHYMRIIHTGGSTNRLLIDDISVANPVPLTRYQDFNAWTNAQANGCHSSNDWIVCTGRITSVMADEGFSATLAPSPTTGFTNYLQTPLMESGYGTISFRYARGTNNTGPAHLNLQSSPDGAAWTTIASVSNIISQSYSDFIQYFYSTNDAYLRILNIFSTNAGDSTILIDEGFAGANTAPPGWTFSGLGSPPYNSAANSGEEIPALKFDTTGDRVTTPPLAGPTNLSFWLKGISTDVASSFKIEGASGGWTTITNIVDLPTTIAEGFDFSVPVSSVYTQLQFTYTKSSGNAAFDDVLITGLPPGPKPAQQLLLDRISIGEAEMVRLQDFNSWPTMSGFGDSTHQGWSVQAARVYDPTNAYDGQSARLDKTVDARAYIQSPYLAGGIGTISFQYARQTAAGSPDPVFVVQISATGASNDWTTLDTLTLNSTAYTEYSRYMYETNKFYLRIYHNSGSGQDAIFDEVQCAEPSPPANMTISGWHDPVQPYTNDAVSLWAYVASLNGAKNWSVTSYYRVGTSGVFTALLMDRLSITDYIATNAIAAKTNGTVVQYYMACFFAGPGSDQTSPAYYPAGGPTNPASYGIPRARPGQVWINELSYDTLFPAGNEFIELCGPAGFNISNWKIQLLDGGSNSFSFAQFGYYPVSSPTILSNDAQDHGFWVLGAYNVAGRDMLLTNDLSYFSLPRPTGIRLLNEFGGIEYALSIQGAMPYCEAVPVYEDWFDTEGLSLSGTGTNYDGFSWVNASVTPGTLNTGQSMNTNIPPFSVMDILDWQLGATITIVTTGTNNWSFAPYYSTNLTAGNAWAPVSVFNSDYANGTNTITFPMPAHTSIYYRVRATP
ncbi:MAG TPA: hypothetical protein PKK36_08065 [Kiritimatiellia bacterium]|nr:hypothetical protein [Kiritimatiellia bacterium]